MLALSGGAIAAQILESDGAELHLDGVSVNGGVAFLRGGSLMAEYLTRFSMRSSLINDSSATEVNW